MRIARTIEANPTVPRHPRQKIALPHSEFHFCEKTSHMTQLVLCMSRKHPEVFAVAHPRLIPTEHHAVYDATCKKCDIWQIVNRLEINSKSKPEVVIHETKRQRKVSRKV